MTPTTVVGRDIFYNNSYYDGNDAADDAAIATDKQALLPGQTATFANYTSYSKGINGIMVDVANLANSSSISASDFTFFVGNNSDPSTWTQGPAPTDVVVRPGAGVNGSDRIELTWGDDAIAKEWLQVTVLADGNTGLTSPDTFYFGNAIGESGNSATDATVNATDSLAARGHAAAGPVSITNQWDFNRDGVVNAADVTVAQQNATSGATALQLINVAATTVPPNADLAVTDVTPPVEGYSGRSISVSWTVANIGTSPTTGSWTDSVYLEVAGSTTDTFLGQLRRPENLSPGANYTRTNTYTLPNGISGQYAIKVVTNSNNGTAEVNAANDILASSAFPLYLSPYADLQVSSVTAPPTATAGQTATFSWTVVNAGTGATDVPQWTDNLYLSTSPTSLTGAILIGSASNPDYLASGDTYNQSLTVTVPSNLTGSYYAIVVTNANQTQYEYVFGNNDTGASVVPVSIQAPVTPAQGFLHVQSVSVSPAPPSTVYAGSTVNVSWTVTNTGNAPITPGDDGYWDDGLALSPTPNWDGVDGYWLGGHQNSETQPLQPGNSYTSQKTISIPQGVTPGTWYIVAVPDTHYWTGGTGIGGSTTPRDQGSAALSIQIPPSPDLQVSTQLVTADIKTVTAGQPVNVTWTVVNDGFAGTSAGSWQDAVYLVSNGSTTISSGALLLGTVTHTGDLDPTESYTTTTAFKVPAGVAPGNYNILVFTDSSNVVKEYSPTYDAEANNVGPASIGTSGTLQVLAAPPTSPDLQITTLTAPTTAQAGRSMSVSWAVSNQGSGATQGSSWADTVYLSPTPSTQLSSSDILVGTFAHSGALGANANYTNTQSVTIPTSVSGSYYVVVFTDSNNAVQESAPGYDAEANNISVASTATLIAAATPPPPPPPPPPVSDLDVTSVGTPSSATAGQSVSFSWTVLNNGPNATTATQWADQVVVSQDDSLATAGDNIVVGSFTHSGALAVGASYSNSASFALPDTFSGTYYVFVTTNDDNGVSEDPGAVNTASAAFSVTPLQPADLQVATIQVPSGAESGQSPTVSWTVTNTGAGATPADETNWTDTVYLAAPGAAAPGTLVGSFIHQGALQPGDSYSQSAQISLAPFVAGTYTVMVVTDTGNAVLGDSATNNHTSMKSFVVSLTPPPDLAAGEITAPGTALAGQPMTIGWQVTNIGAGATPNAGWNDSVYLSPDQFLDPTTAVYLGTVSHTGALPAGASYTASLTTTLSANLSGPYYVFVVADSGRQVFENGATANDTAFSSTAVTVSFAPQSDLVPTAITVPATGQPGQPASAQITWTVTNNGANAAVGQWSDSVYLSTDGEFDASSLLIATVVHTGDLAPGASYVASTNAPLPAIAPGNYHLIVRTDVLNNVRESDEDNNQLTSTATIGIANVPALPLDTPTIGTIASGQNAYYAIAVPAGESLTISLNSNTANSAQVLVRFGALPTPLFFDSVLGVESNNPQQQQLSVPATQAGVYYVLVQGTGVAGSGQQYTIEAHAVGYGITGVSPSYGSTAGSATVVITGAQLSGQDEVTLQGPGGTRAASQQWWINSSTIWATFNLAGLTPGQYDVVSTQDGSVSTLSGAFTVNRGSAGALQVHVVPPGTVRPGTTGTVTIQYTNVGNTDIQAPLLEVTATNALLQAVGQSGFSSNPVEVLGINNTGPAGILPPGVTGQITLEYQAPSSQGSFQITATPISPPLPQLLAYEILVDSNPQPPIDWSFLTSARPSTITEAAWTAIVNNFLANVGTSWASYQLALDLNATYLSQLGEATDDVNQLTAFILEQAMGGFTPPVLATSQDLSLPGPGLQLGVTRQYLTSIEDRFTLGMFGYGWSTQWDTSLGVDSSGNVTILADGNVQSFTRQSSTTFVAQAGDPNTLTFDQGLYVLTAPDGTTSTYSSSGQLVNVDDTNGNTITALYTGNLLTELVHSDGDTLSFTYNAQGHVTKAVDSAGDTATYTYDSTGEYLMSVTTPQGTTSYTYSTPIQLVVLGSGPGGSTPGSSLASIAFPDGTHEYFTYDGEDRLFATSQDGNANEVTYTYEQPGEVTTTDAVGDASRTFYDDRGLVARTQDSLGNITSYAYDPSTLLVSQVTDPANQTQSFLYDKLGNLLSSTNQLGNTTLFSYGNNSRLTSMTDANGNRTSYSYDADGNLLSTTYADASTSTSTFDPEGDPLSFINQDGQAIAYTYNSRGQLATESFPDGSQYTYTYDAFGDLLTATDATGTTSFTYNSAHQLTEVDYPGGLFLKFTLDAGGRRIQMVDQTGFTTNYSYDAAGRLAGLTDGDGNPIVTYTYNAADQLTYKLNGNGTYTTYDYDADGNVLHLVNYAPDGSVNSRFDYTYNNLGLETTEATIDGTWTYSYDSTGQLMHAVFASTNPSIANQDLTYNYDAVGNRTTTVTNGVTMVYTTNNMNEYTSVGGVAYTYDKDGNLLSDGSNSYSYNALNQLTGIVNAQGVTSYTFNALGQRVASTFNGVTTTYLVDPSGTPDVVAAYDQQGSATSRYIFGAGLTSELTPTGTLYLEYDNSGSTVGLTGGPGVPITTYAYSPFGTQIGSGGGVSASNPFTFQGESGITTDDSGQLETAVGGYNASLGGFTSSMPVPTTTAGSQGPAPSIWEQMSSVLGTLKNGVDDVNKFVDSPFLDDLSDTLDKAQTIAEIPLKVDELGNDINSGNYLRAGLDDGAFFSITIGLFTAEGYFGLAGTIFEADKWIYDHPDQITSWGITALDVLDYFGYDGVQNALLEAGDYINSLSDFLGSLFGGDTGDGNCVVPRDPNEKIGPIGTGLSAFVVVNQALPYEIDFENQPSATAPAQVVTVTDQLSSSLDWRTFQLGTISFGAYTVQVPAGRSFYSTVLQLGPAQDNLVVDIDAGIDPTTGIVHWTFATIDPATNQHPVSPLEGFLPPDDPAGDGEGRLTYSVKPLAVDSSGTVISNQATITFDTQPPIDTNTVANTLDATPPTSSVVPLPATSSPSFLVSWSGQDDAGGSGLADYDVYVSINGQPYAIWQQATTQTSATFTGQAGQTYSFYSVALDNAGNVEATPAVAEATTTIPAATILGRYVFYNDSYYDGNDPTANASDDGAIAIDKQALLPGQTATFANYTSYSKGINGIMIDVSNLENADALSAADFTFKLGNSNDPSTWTTAPAPTAVILRQGAGANGSDRIELVWADGAIKDEWLQVTMLANANTGLARPDVFYFGNAVGDSGNSATDAAVNAGDSLGARSHAAAGPVPITDQWDYNRDGAVNGADVTIAQQNGTSGTAALQLISTTAGASSAIVALHDAALAEAVLAPEEPVPPETLVEASASTLALTESASPVRVLLPAAPKAISLSPELIAATAAANPVAPPIGPSGNQVVSGSPLVTGSASQPVAATVKQAATRPTVRPEYTDAALNELNDEILAPSQNFDGPIKRIGIFL
ncbi:MAG TPA: CARDB domain-containing protein [Pirellulales bacterium]|jgi:YD repeat-containing protein